MNINNCIVTEIVTIPILQDKTWLVMVEYRRQDGFCGMAPLLFHILEDAENVSPGYEFQFEGYEYI